MTDNQRDFEASAAADQQERLTYDGYLSLDKLLSAQHPLSGCHDEMLFIVQHQVTELWMKLFIHELRAAILHVRNDALETCLKIFWRIKQIQRQLFEQWAVLETLAPVEFLQFRKVLGQSSGFQSQQYRQIEFMLGNKQASLLRVFEADPAAQALLREVLEAPSLYDEFLRMLARHGHALPADLLERDWTRPHRYREDLLPVFKRIYENPLQFGLEYRMCEQLVELEESFQLWRFRHMKTVARVIGQRRGTGGSSGVGYLKKVLELRFFPELTEVRTVLGT